MNGMKHIDTLLEDIVTHGATFMGHDIHDMNDDQLRRALVYCAHQKDVFGMRYHDPRPLGGMKLSHAGKHLVASRNVGGVVEEISLFKVLRSTVDGMFFEIRMDGCGDTSEWVSRDHFDKVGVLVDQA